MCHFIQVNHMKLRAIGVLLLSLLTIGCTGTQTTIKPDPLTLSTQSPKKFESVGLKARTSEYPPLAPAGNLTDGFASTLEETGFAKKLYYPLRGEDKPEILLEPQFSARADLHSGANFAKAFFTGFTLFLLEPVIWFDYDYTVEGNVIVSRNGERLQTINARSDATISAKWLSLSEISRLEAEALMKAKRSLYLQLMHDIH